MDDATATVFEMVRTTGTTSTVDRTSLSFVLVGCLLVGPTVPGVLFPNPSLHIKSGTSEACTTHIPEDETQSSVTVENAEPIASKQFEVLITFASKLLSESRNLESGIVEAIDEEFWDLLA